MANRITTVRYDELEAYLIERAETGILKSGVGAIVRGQALAKDYATGKLVKYVSGASNGTEYIVAIALEAADSTSADVAVSVMVLGSLPKGEIVGINTINGLTGEAVVTTLNVGVGSLTDATTYQYTAQPENKAGLFTPGAADSELTADPNLSITVAFTVPTTATSMKLWRTDDAGTTYEYIELTGDQMNAGTITDDGTLTWTAGTGPVTADDYEGISEMGRSGIFLDSSTDGYNYNYR